MYRFLETDIGKQQKYERAIQASVDNTGNDLRHKINFENCVKNKSNLSIEHSLSLNPHSDTPGFLFHSFC